MRGKGAQAEFHQAEWELLTSTDNGDTHIMFLWGGGALVRCREWGPDQPTSVAVTFCPAVVRANFVTVLDPNGRGR